jgi:hypothetical protein
MLQLLSYVCSWVLFNHIDQCTARSRVARRSHISSIAWFDLAPRELSPEGHQAPTTNPGFAQWKLIDLLTKRWSIRNGPVGADGAIIAGIGFVVGVAHGSLIRCFGDFGNLEIFSGAADFSQFSAEGAGSKRFA